MTVRLTTLGHPSVLLGEEHLPSLPGKPVTFGLLVFLAVERETTRDKLVSVFWPESSQENARHALSQTLYELRQALGEDWMESRGNLVRVADSVWVDCLEFADLAEAGRHEEAVKLYGGGFLDGVYLAQTQPFEEWVEGRRGRVARRYRAAVDAFITECRGRGELETALTSAWKWVEMDPLDEGGQQHLIQLLAETGSRPEALAQYDRYAALLEAELGLEPLDETVELVEKIRTGAVRPVSSGRGGKAPQGENPAGSGGAARDGIWPPPVPSGAGTGAALDRMKDRDQLQKKMESELSPDLQVLRPISQGNMAEVFLAREPHLKRLVAVKALSPHLYSDPVARKRFEREAQAAARLNHPNVCTVHRVGSLSDGTPFLVSPFIKGTTLGQRLKAEGRLSPTEVRRVLREVASALAAAHKLGIIHRDVRPENVLRADEDGRHSLCDFGIAGVLETGEDSDSRLTGTGEIPGHPEYISPEQMDGKPLTDRADIYSLGVMAHRLLTGHPPPPRDDSGPGTARKNASGMLEPLADFMGDTDPDLVKLLDRCLATDPSHRPSAADVERRCGERSEQVGIPPDFIPSPTSTFFSLLMERRFFQIIGGYIAGSFLCLEAVDQLGGHGYVPDAAYPLALTTAVFGFLVTNILAWYHGMWGKQELSQREKWLLGLLGVGWVVAAVWVVA